MVEEGAKRPLARAFPGKFAFLLSQPSQKGRKRMEKEGEKREKRGRKEGTPAVAMLDKNGVKILDNIAIVKSCPKILR